MYANKINTPEELKPVIGEDYGMTLVHRGGQPSEYIHEVGISESDRQIWTSLKNGYKQAFGFIQNGVQMWVYRREYPLYVSSW